MSSRIAVSSSLLRRLSSSRSVGVFMSLKFVVDSVTTVVEVDVSIRFGLLRSCTNFVPGGKIGQAASEGRESEGIDMLKLW